MMKRIFFYFVACLLAITSIYAQSIIENGKGIINGHEYVDLGLSVKWATCNVGADSPSGYGNYYAWGEITPKQDYLKTNDVLLPKKTFKISGDPRYDAACANWGDSWRLPTRKEIRELERKCRWVLTNIDGIEGLLVSLMGTNMWLLLLVAMIIMISGLVICFKEAYPNTKIWGILSNQELII